MKVSNMPEIDQGLDDQTRYRVIPRTLVFIQNGKHILLIKGSPNKKAWPNLYNGIGGHIEKDETIQEAALREVQEETGLTNLNDLTLRAIITIAPRHAPDGILLFIFTVQCSITTVQSSREGTLEWVVWQELPKQLLVEDLPILLTRILDEKPTKMPLYATYSYNDSDKLLILYFPLNQGTDSWS